jgi:hypothetical protein
MITIYFSPTETNPNNDGKAVEKEEIRKRSLTRYIVAIVLLLGAIVISLMTACSGVEAPAIYQYHHLPIQSLEGSKEAGFLAYQTSCSLIGGLLLGGTRNECKGN